MVGDGRFELPTLSTNDALYQLSQSPKCIYICRAGLEPARSKTESSAKVLRIPFRHPEASIVTLSVTTRFVLRDNEDSNPDISVNEASPTEPSVEPETGLEPARFLQHYHLKVASIPVSPPRLIVKGLVGLRGLDHPLRDTVRTACIHAFTTSPSRYYIICIVAEIAKMVKACLKNKL